MTKSAKRSAIFSALLAIALCVSLMAGATFALFTSESTVNIAVTSGKVNVVATIDETSLETYSGKDLTGATTDAIVKNDGTTFANGGTASISGNTLTLSEMTPGDKVTFNIKVTNKSNVAIKYRTKVTYESDSWLSDALTVTIGGETFGRKIITAYQSLAANEKVSEADGTIPVIVEMSSSVGNEYQGLSCKMNYIVEAIQGNAVGETDSYPVYPAGVTDDSFGTNTLAYVTANGVEYSTDFAALVKKPTVSEIYCMANSNFTGLAAHMSFNRDLTIYGNGANFNGADLDVSNISAAENGDAREVALNIYDTNNLRVWGTAIKTGATLNLYEEGCTFTGTSRVVNGEGLVFTKGDEDKETNQGTLNAIFKYCKVTNTSQAYSTSSKGKTTFENCIFRDCGIAVKTKLKTLSTVEGTRADTIKDCLFVNCGVALSENETFAKYAAPISYSNDNESGKNYNGTLTLAVSGCKFYNTIGENGGILLGDNRDGERFRATTLTLTTTETVSVRKAHDSIDSYAAGTHTIVCAADPAEG